MKTRSLIVIAAMAVALAGVPAFAQDAGGGPDPGLQSLPPDAAPCSAVGIAEGPLSFAATCTVKREVVFEDVVHYSFRVQVGPGEHDLIGLHRVVRERSPWRPARGLEGLFAISGGYLGFEGLYLTSLADPEMPPEHAFPVFLARHDVDVWGIDLGWSLIPPETDDVSFLEHWDIPRDARDVLIGLRIARLSRVATGSGFGRMHVLAASYGYMVGFVAAQIETTLPPGLRQIKGVVASDGYFDCEGCRPYACAMVADLEDLLAAGVYADEGGSIAALMAQLAAAAPDDPSPFAEGFTNHQFLLAYGAMTWLFGPENPHYHLYAGVFDELGMAVDFQYTPFHAVLTMLMHGAPYFPNAVGADWNRQLCGEVDSPLDDRLGDLTIPVFYLASGGGTGDHGLASLDLIGSEDVTSLVVRLLPPEDPYPFMDFGHADLWVADNAEELVWQPILDWLELHWRDEAPMPRVPWSVRRP